MPFQVENDQTVLGDAPCPSFKLNDTIASGDADVVGPGSSTDNAIARFHLATGKIIQDSVVLISDSGDVTLPTTSALFLRDAGLYLRSPSDGNLELIADGDAKIAGATTTTMGVAGTIELGDGSERDMRPNTTLMVNLGTDSKQFHDLYIGGTAQFSNWFKLKDETAAQLTADVNNYDVGDAPVIRLSSDASRTITGITWVAGGRTVWLVNVGSFNIVLANQSGSSAATARIITGTGSDWTLTPDGAALLWYDDTTDRWRIFVRS